MKTTVVALALLASADAFAPSFINKQIVLTRGIAMVAEDDDGPDYDAPLERRMAVGNVVRSEEPSSLIPKFVQNLFNKDEGSSIKRANPTVMNMDDECYMGKDGDADDCVDFDPPVTPAP